MRPESGPAAPAVRRFIALCGLVLLGAAFGPSPAAVTAREEAEETAEDAPAAEIRHLLKTQAAAWNRGDLEGFMHHYLHGPDLVFTSGTKVRRGYDQFAEDFRRRYATREAMGRLTFSQVEVHPLGEAAAWVLGEWDLERASGDLGGNFTLVLVKEGGAWKIVHDHTSSRPETPQASAKP